MIMLLDILVDCPVCLGRISCREIGVKPSCPPVGRASRVSRHEELCLVARQHAHLGRLPDTCSLSAVKLDLLIGRPKRSLEFEYVRVITER